jgi:hypothetical protein
MYFLGPYRALSDNMLLGMLRYQVSVFRFQQLKNFK